MMKRIFTLLLCFAILAALCGCVQVTGEMKYSGIYVKTADGQHILIRSTEDGEEYFLLHERENCKSLDKLKTGDKIKITVACLAYEDVEFSERGVYDWSKVLFGHTDVSQETLDHIEELLAQYTAQ